MSLSLSKEEKERRLAHILSWQSKGMSMRAYSHEAGLTYNSFKQWCYRWKQANGHLIVEASKPGHFVPVEVASAKPAKSDGVELGNCPPRFELKLLFGLIHFRIG